ncbi:MAG: hypothetical protein ACLVL7_06285, partial [Anaerotruncus massiliensis (ex Togo et al. 2019)]
RRVRARSARVRSRRTVFRPPREELLSFLLQKKEAKKMRPEDRSVPRLRVRRGARPRGPAAFEKAGKTFGLGTKFHGRRVRVRRGRA